MPACNASTAYAQGVFACSEWMTLGLHRQAEPVCPCRSGLSVGRMAAIMGAVNANSKPNARPGADCLQRPLLRRFRFRQRLRPGVRLRIPPNSPMGSVNTHRRHLGSPPKTPISFQRCRHTWQSAMPSRSHPPFYPIENQSPATLPSSRVLMINPYLLPAMINSG
jgi:hypothetical protein